MKFCAKRMAEIDTKDGENICAKCANHAAFDRRVSRLRERRERDRKGRHEALTSLGLIRVRGAMGGVYYE